MSESRTRRCPVHGTSLYTPRCGGPGVLLCVGAGPRLGGASHHGAAGRRRGARPRHGGGGGRDQPLQAAREAAAGGAERGHGAVAQHPHRHRDIHRDIGISHVPHRYLAT